nr:DUF1317 family protein [Enterobacter hormaechei]
MLRASTSTKWSPSYDSRSRRHQRLPFIGNCWLIPWGEVVSNPLKAQRLAEKYRERQEAA